MNLSADAYPASPPSVTELLSDASNGDQGAVNALFARLYPEIKRAARSRLADSGDRLGLNTTALVHESFIRMADSEGLQGASRGQFFSYVGRVLRSVVIDHVRARSADKRGGDAADARLTLSAAEGVASSEGSAQAMVALEKALGQMAQLDAGLYELVEMVSFAGTSPGEVALLRGVSLRTVERDLAKARALLSELLGDDVPPIR
jgi:RNA polymerase sigma factor (TIGR02999 family)